MALISLTNDNFDKEVIEYDGLVLVDFWAAWCGPCQILGPIIESLANEVGDKVKICKLDVDAVQDKAGEFGIMSIPTVILFKKGKPMETWVGVRDKTEYIAGINTHK